MAAAAVAGSPTQAKPSARELQERVAAIQQKAMTSVRRAAPRPRCSCRALAAAPWAPRGTRETAQPPRDGDDMLRKRLRPAARAASACATGSARVHIRATFHAGAAPVRDAPIAYSRAAATQGLLDEQFTQLQQLQDDDNSDFLEEVRSRNLCHGRCILR
jgi:hypothetical protein